MEDGTIVKGAGGESYLVSPPKPPVYAGYYRIGDLVGAMQVMLPTKPKWLHRKFTQLLLGWEWIDIKDVE